jgi:hypothetical protein
MAAEFFAFASLSVMLKIEVVLKVIQGPEGDR